jgi:hypothetical protein
MYKPNNIVVAIVIIITLLAGVSSIIGMKAWPTIKIHSTYISPRGDTTQVLTTGIYKHNPDWFVAEGIAWDYVTFFFAIPLMLFGLFIYIKQNIKGKIVLIGILTYFAYTYLLYGTGWAFNELFFLYTTIISLSIIGICLLCYNFDVSKIFSFDKSKIPFKSIAVFSIIIGLFIAKMWITLVLKMIQRGNGNMPESLSGINSFVVQTFDLGLIVPLALITGFLLFRKIKVGILLSFIIIVKGLVMALAISVMVILKGVLTGHMPYADLVPFIILFLAAGYFFLTIMRAKTNID